MSDSRSLDDLHPQVRIMARQLIEQAKCVGIPLTVTFTLRSFETQAILYAQGRTAPGRVVTNARAGYSYHNYGLALDVVPTSLLALPKWGDTADCQGHTNNLWSKVGAIGKEIGFRWGGDFIRFKDRPHFEWSGELTLADLRAGRQPSMTAWSPTTKSG